MAVTKTVDTTTAPGYTIIKWTGFGDTTWVTGDDNAEGVSCSYLCIGGGGSGGSYYGCGGGGAGEMATGTQVVSGTVNITIGAGGAAAATNSAGNDGASTVFGAYKTSVGGAKGPYYGAPNGYSGACGSGGHCSGGTAGTATVHYNGGAGAAGGGNNDGGGGGGGAGGAGTAGDGSGTQAAGGIGVANSLTGSSVTYCIGGAGGCYDAGDASAVTENRGHGGGGGGASNPGGVKGSNGYLVVKFIPGSGGGGGAVNKKGVSLMSLNLTEVN